MLHITLPGGVKREFAVGTTLAEMGKDFGRWGSVVYSHEFRRRDACLCPQHRICL